MWSWDSGRSFVTTPPALEAAAADMQDVELADGDAEERLDDEWEAVAGESAAARHQRGDPQIAKGLEPRCLKPRQAPRR